MTAAVARGPSSAVDLLACWLCGEGCKCPLETGAVFRDVPTAGVYPMSRSPCSNSAVLDGDVLCWEKGEEENFRKVSVSFVP